MWTIPSSEKMESPASRIASVLCLLMPSAADGILDPVTRTTETVLARSVQPNEPGAKPSIVMPRWHS